MAKRIKQQNDTKKEMIAKILLDRDKKYSAREIARIVGTTEGNVFKEKSRLKATGVLTDERLSVFSHSAGDETLMLARSEAKTLIASSDLRPLTDLSPLQEEDLMKMYSEFQECKTPAEVIAAYGFNPMLVEYEYNRYTRMKGLNLKSIGKRLVEGLGPFDDEELNLLKEKIEKDGITSNDEIDGIVRLIRWSAHRKGQWQVRERIRNGQYDLPFVPFHCYVCRESLEGALYDPSSDIGKMYKQQLIRPMHAECYNRSV